MSILLMVANKSSAREAVLGQHHQPFSEKHGVGQAIIDANVLVAEVMAYPEPQPQKTHVHYVNPQTGEQWFEIIDVPLTEQEVLIKKLNALEIAVDELIFGGGF